MGRGRGNRIRWARRWAIALVSSLISGGLTAAITPAAERIDLTFGALELSLELESLEQFAATGKISDELKFYTRFLTPEQLAQVRSGLTDRLDINLLAVSSFFNSPQGETILRRLAQVIRTGRNLRSVPALRAAIVQSAADPGGLTPLNLLRYYPTSALRVDLVHALSLWRQIQETTIRHGLAIESLEAEFQTQLGGAPAEAPQFKFQEAGPHPVAKTSRTLNPLNRRSFGADVYWPLNGKGSHPVVVISHGLGSDRRTYAYLGQHLASYGFVTILLEHPGSNSRYIQDLVEGRASEFADPAEFLARPADVSDSLDAIGIDPQPPSNFQGSLALDRVAVVGQSFGGYTALVTAGATLNFKQLQADCDSDDLFWNTSLLLQCRALVMRPAPDVDQLSLRDPRVQAVVAINPIISSLFGQSGIATLQVPTAIVTGTDDPIALPLPEQLRPFAQLPIVDKRLLVLKGGTHFSTMGATGDERFQFPPSVVGPRPDLARDYLKAFVTAFLMRYLLDDRSTQQYLTASWAQSVSQPALPLYLLERLPIARLPQSDRRARSTPSRLVMQRK